MIIEDLVRLGKPLLEGGLSPRDILELVSDMTDPKVKNFYRHVFVIEVPPAGRYRLLYEPEPHTAAQTARRALEALAAEGSVAVTVNTIRDAVTVYHALEESLDSEILYCLTGMMLPGHKARTIDTIARHPERPPVPSPLPAGKRLAVDPHRPRRLLRKDRSRPPPALRRPPGKHGDSLTPPTMSRSHPVTLPEPDPFPPPATYLTVTHVRQHLFCPRFTYFEYVLRIPEHQEKRYKVQRGREIHVERQQVNPRYLRKKLGVVRREFDVELASLKHRLKGVVDEVVWLADGGMAPLDYKFARDPGHLYEDLRVQSILYGFLLRENYDTPVTRGYLCYTRSNYRIREIPFTEKDFTGALRVLEECLDIIQTGVFPASTATKARCADCCYRNLCIR